MEQNTSSSGEPPAQPGQIAKIRAFVSENFSGIAVLIAGVMIAGAVMSKNGSILPDRQGAPRVPAPNEAAVAVQLGNLPVLGNSGAKVTVVEFGDFQCPFCGRFHQTVEPQLREEYVKSGKVKFVWRDFAFLGEESVWAAEAARCANDQGKFWEYHDLLFQSQNGENQGAFRAENLKRFAKDLGLDEAKFNQCLDSHSNRAAVEKDTADGRNYGVNGTPTSFVNGKQVVGAVPYEDLKKVIDGALK